MRISSCKSRPYEGNFGVHPDMERLAESGAEWVESNLRLLEALFDV